MHPHCLKNVRKIHKRKKEGFTEKHNQDAGKSGLKRQFIFLDYLDFNYISTVS
jgi:hypothetical protein